MTDTFAETWVNGCRVRRNDRLPEMLAAIRRRWAEEAEVRVEGRRVKAVLRRVA